MQKERHRRLRSDREKNEIIKSLTHITLRAGHQNRLLSINKQNTNRIPVNSVPSAWWRSDGHRGRSSTASRRLCPCTRYLKRAGNEAHARDASVWREPKSADNGAPSPSSSAVKDSGLRSWPVNNLRRLMASGSSSGGGGPFSLKTTGISYLLSWKVIQHFHIPSHRRQQLLLVVISGKDLGKLKNVCGNFILYLL